MRRPVSAASRRRRARLCVALLAASPGIALADASPAGSPMVQSAAASGASPTGVADAVAPRAVRAPSIEFSVDSTVTATDNANAASDATKRGDVLGILRPHALWRHDAPGLKANLEGALVFTGSASGRTPDTVRPDLHGSGTASLVDDWLYLDASARVVQAEADPFGPRVQDSTAANRRTEQAAAVSPWVRHRLSRTMSMLLRREDTITWHATGTDTTRVTQLTDLRLDLDPEPLGGVAELSRQASHDRDMPLSALTLDTARAGLRYGRENSELVLTAEGGADHLRTALTEHTDPLAAVSATWKPTPRTDIGVLVEHRFFGKGGAFTLRHRTPWTSISIDVSREPMLVSESLGGLAGLNGGADLRAALDALLTTRYPDPTVRSGLVDQIITGRGLDGSVTAPMDTLADYPQLVTQASAAWTVLTTRTTFSVAAWSRAAQVLRRNGDPLAALPGFGSDNRQVGGTVQFGRKLSSTLSLDALAQVSRIQALGSSSNLRSDDRTLRVWLSRSLTPRATMSVGAQVERFDSNAPGQPGFHATLAFAGFTERF